MTGSSPRGRGKPRIRRRGRRGGRLIPAWAGKTSSAAQSATPTTAHPRVGGENVASSPFAALVSGSSPRGRGKRGREFGVAALRGLIPAWAGKTGPRGDKHGGKRAHPRVGGENDAAGGEPGGGAGSSPRGRGKLVARFYTQLTRRLIPAWAGKTEFFACVLHLLPAHPRVGGENGSFAVLVGR